MQKVTIVNMTETYTVKGLMKKLEEFGIPSRSVNYAAKHFESFLNDTSTFILMVDDAAAEVIDYVDDNREVFTSPDIHVLLVGTKADLKAFDNYVSLCDGWEFVERPINIASIIEKVRTRLDLVNMESEKPCVLIIDDDPTYCNMVRDWIKRRYRVRIANSGAYAIAWLASNHADCILLDFEMPITSGPLMLQMLRSEAATASIPTLFLTGKADQKSIMQVVDLKPDDYLLKSIKKDDLLEKLKQHIGR